MVYKLSRNMVTKLETFAQYSKGTSYKGTWLSTEVFLIYIPQRSRCRSLIGLNSAKILIFGLRLLGLLVQADGLDDHLGHRVRVAVAAWSSVLQVPVALLRHLSGNSDAAAPVGNAGREVMDGGSLVGIVGLDVPHVVAGQLVNSGLNCLDASLDPHGFGGEVCVGASSVPVAGHRLGVKGYDDAEVFSDTLEKVAADPEVITHVDALSGPHLVLPLGGHHLGVGSGYPDTSIEAGPVVSLDDVPAVDVAGTDGAVVRALGSRETVLGPAEGVTVLVEKGVFLLNSEPGVVALGLLHHLGALLPLVGLSLLLVVLVGLAHHHDVLATPEGVRVEFDWVEVGIGVGSFSLVTRRSIVVPDWEVSDRVGVLLQGLGLRPQTLSSPINPDVQCLNPGALVKFHVLVQYGLVGLGVHRRHGDCQVPWSPV